MSTTSLPEILQYLRDRDGHITFDKVLETASLYDGKAPASVPMRGSLSLGWHVFNELLTRRWIERVQGCDMCRISATGLEHLKLTLTKTI